MKHVPIVFNNVPRGNFTRVQIANHLRHSRKLGVLTVERDSLTTVYKSDLGGIELRILVAKPSFTG